MALLTSPAAPSSGMLEKEGEPEVDRHQCLISGRHASEQLPVVVPTMQRSLQDNCESEAHHRRVAEQLAESNRNLERLVRAQAAELEVVQRYLDTFSDSVGHDLRAPLRSIAGFSEALAEECSEGLGDTGREYLAHVQASAQRMDDLLEALLGMSRVLRSDLRSEPVDLSALAVAIAFEIQSREPERTAVFAIEPGLEAIGDRALLGTALRHLLGNAWKFTAKRHQARIEVGRSRDDSGKPIFFVRDNGAGFDMRYAQRLFGIFQRFHRLDDFPGTGVGLATVERIVARHGGRVWAETRPDAGATFFVSLPAA